MTKVSIARTQQDTPKLSTGDPSTLGTYLKLTSFVFGEDSKAVDFLKQKIEKQGEYEVVVAEESQMIHLLNQIHLGNTKL